MANASTNETSELMGAANGYVLYLPADRQSVLERCIDEQRVFGEPVPEFDHSRNVALICFVVSEHLQITHFARGRRGVSAGTDMRRLNLKDANVLGKPISTSRITERIPNRLRRGVANRLPFGGLLTPKGFAAVDAIRDLEPSTRSILDRFSSARTDRIQGLSNRVRQALAFQKEAVVTALSIADLDRSTLQDWTPISEAEPVSFLEGLPTARLREDPIVINDLMNFPGFDLIKSLPYTAAVFKSDSGERLTVILANRQPLEVQTGTDLIYFNETFECFVMVQYKMMESDHDHRRPIFRLPNEDLTKEIEKMNKVLVELRGCGGDDSRDGFRLNENPFFLKLCPRLVFNPDDVGLVPGMYLPLDYWRVLAKHPDVEGPRGGQRVTYDNVGRYFDNTAFASLVAKGWVGTTAKQSGLLKEAIRGTLESGKAVAIAIKSADLQSADFDEATLEFGEYLE